MHGGARKGAGRPKKDGEVREQHTLRATKDEWALIAHFAKLVKYGDKESAKNFLLKQAGD